MKIRFCILLIAISYYLNTSFAVPRNSILLVKTTAFQHLIRNSSKWPPEALTKDRKPKSSEEKLISSTGELVVLNKSNVRKVVWNRLNPDHCEPVHISKSDGKTPILAVPSSLEERQLQSESDSSRKNATISITPVEKHANTRDAEVKTKANSFSSNTSISGARNSSIIAVSKTQLPSLNNKEKQQQPLKVKVDQGKMSKTNLSPVTVKIKLNTSNMNDISRLNNIPSINKNKTEAKSCCALQVNRTIHYLQFLSFKDVAPKVKIFEYVINKKLKVLPKSTRNEMQVAEEYSYEAFEGNTINEGIKKLFESATNEMQNILYYWYLKNNSILKSEIFRFSVSFLASTVVLKISNFLWKKMASIFFE